MVVYSCYFFVRETLAPLANVQLTCVEWIVPAAQARREQSTFVELQRLKFTHRIMEG